MYFEVLVNKERNNFFIFTVFTCSSVYKIIIETCFYTNIDIGKYRLSAVTAILISDIGIGQNFHIGASLMYIYIYIRVSAEVLKVLKSLKFIFLNLRP